MKLALELAWRERGLPCLAATRGAAQWLGVTPEQLVGAPLLELAPILADAVASFCASSEATSVAGLLESRQLPLLLPRGQHTVPVELSILRGHDRLTLEWCTIEFDARGASFLHSLLESSKATVPDEHGLIYATARDVTRPEQHADLLSPSVGSHVKHAIVMTDDRGVLEWCSHGFMRMCGYAEHELVGRRLGALLQGPETDPVEARRIRRCVRAGVAFQAELLNYHKSGRRYWVHIEAEPIIDDTGRRHFLAVEVDVSEERRRAEALAASEARLRATLTASTDAIYWLTAVRDDHGELIDFEFIDVNPAAEAELGMTNQELLGRRINELFPINDSGGFFAQYKQVAESGELLDQEYEIPQGHAAPGHYRHIVLPLDDGLAIFNRNLNAEKLREAAQRRSLRMAALGRLASGIAHDFNNVLAGILFCAELLDAHVADNPRARAIVANIVASGKRAGQFVKQVLMFARQTEHELSATHIDSVCAETLEMLGRTLPTTAALHVDVEARLVARSDAAQIQQLLTNLVTNAKQALPDARGNIWVSLRALATDELPDALRTDQASERCALLEVRDDGVGMDPATLEHVFDPFFSTKSPEHGTGLGLSIVHNIVEVHDGRVAVDSNPGMGTCIRIALPLLSDAHTHAVIADEPAAAPTRAKTRVLLLDDDELIVESLSLSLSRRGLEVLSATDPDEALALLREQPHAIDAAVIDVDMPGRNGIEIAAELHACYPELALLTMTGGGRLLDEAVLREAGIARVLEKPFSSDQLLVAIHELLGDTRGVLADFALCSGP